MPTSEFEDEPPSPSPSASEKPKVKGKGKTKKSGKKKKEKQPPPAKKGGGHTYKIEGMEDAITKQELKKERRKKRRQRRYELVGKITVALCFCGCIAAIVVVALVIAEVGKWADADESSSIVANTVATPAPTLPVPGGLRPTTKAPVAPAPTEAPVPTKKPTPSPTRMATPNPTSSPTKSPAPTLSVKDTYTLIPNQDTYIYRDGFYQFQANGREETFLVQNGLAAKQEIPDSFAIMTFDMTDIPSFDRLASDGKTATLRLTHKALDLGDLDEEPAPITVSRMPSTPLDVESLHGGSFNPEMFGDWPTLIVETTATVVNFDITDLVFSDAFEGDQLFLMLENRGPEQESGDRFFSRESDTPPQLILSNLKP